MSVAPQTADLSVARRRLALDSIGIWVLAIVIGTIFGFTAREADLSLVEAAAFSSILFAGASQFAALEPGGAWIAANGGYFGSLEYPQYIKTANKDNTPFYKASYIASYVFVGSIMGSILVAISPVSIPYIVYMYKIDFAYLTTGELHNG